MGQLALRLQVGELHPDDLHLLDPDLTVLSTGTHGEHAPAGGQRSGACAPVSVEPQNRAYRVDGCDHWSEREQNDRCCQQ
jgi:hypothetical protein